MPFPIAAAIGVSAGVGIVAGLYGAGQQADAAAKAAGISAAGQKRVQQYGRDVNTIIDSGSSLYRRLGDTAARGLADEVNVADDEFSTQYFQDVSDDVRRAKFALSATGKRGSGEAAETFGDILLSRGGEEYNRRYGLDIETARLGAGAREGIAAAGGRTLGNISNIFSGGAAGAGNLALAQGQHAATLAGVGAQAVQGGINTYLASTA